MQVFDFEKNANAREESNMGGYTCTRRMPHGKCMWSAIAAATLVGVLLLVNLVVLTGPMPPTRSSISNRFDALSNPRVLLIELPTAFKPRHRATAERLLEEKKGVNNKADFTDAQFVETVEQQYNRIISSQKWLRQRVTWEEHGLQKGPEIKFDSGSRDMTVTLFSAPRAFTGDESDRNRQALLSWLHLSPRPKVVLLGNHSSLHAVAEEFAGLVFVEPDIDYSFTGVPLFHSMVARANAVDTNITVLVHPSAVLLQDFMPGIRKLTGTFVDWALVSQRLETPNLPFRFVHKGGGIVFLEHSVSGDSMIDREMASFVRKSGELELEEGVSVWAWTVSADEPLFDPPMPSFTYGAGYHDRWMARGIAKGARVVVDVTDALVSFHVREVHDNVSRVMNLVDETLTTKADTPTLSWTMVGQQWQYLANLYLYRKELNITAEEKDLLSGGWKLIGCPDPFMIKLCISETHSAANPCRCENFFSRPVSGVRYAETFLEKEARLRLEVIELPSLAPEPSSFHTLDNLLPRIADEHKNVILVGVTSADEGMLWSFICRAKALGVTNILVAAFDMSVYESALVRGLPVFYAGPEATEDFNPASQPASDSSSPSGAQQVESSTKWKVRVVLQVLENGFHVLWSDVDVVWFQNPLPHLASTHKSGTLAVESDEPDVNLPANSGGRVNAGFFYARAEKPTIKTFRRMDRSVRGPAADPQLEELLFSQALCGRRVGATECTASSSGLRTRFLDRQVFANGVVNGFWWQQNVTQVAASNGVYVLHNNWAHGAQAKASRQKAKLVWFFNDADNMCAHPWQRRSNESSHPGDASLADTELV